MEINMEYFNYATNISFLVFICAIATFGAQEKTMIRAAWFSITIFFTMNLIRYT